MFFQRLTVYKSILKGVPRLYENMGVVFLSILQTMRCLLTTAAMTIMC